MRINDKSSDPANDIVSLLVPGQNLTWHSMYANTTCPGDYLRSKMQYIADKANEKMTNFKYRSHIENIGWQEWKQNGEMAGTSGRSLRLEAINIQLLNNILQIGESVDIDVNDLDSFIFDLGIDVERRRLLDNYKFKISSDAFFQININQMKKLYDIVRNKSLQSF